jgi:hypothetical protein
MLSSTVCVRRARREPAARRADGDALVLNLSKREHSLLDIAERSGLPSPRECHGRAAHGHGLLAADLEPQDG